MVRKKILMLVGDHVEASGTHSNARTDGNLVTASAWPAYPEWMRQLPRLPGAWIVA